MSLDGDVDFPLAMSSNGPVIAAMSKYVCVCEDGLRQMSAPKQKKRPNQIFVSPAGQYVVAVEEKNESRVLQVYRANDTFSTIEVMVLTE